MNRFQREVCCHHGRGISSTGNGHQRVINASPTCYQRVTSGHQRVTSGHQRRQRHQQVAGTRARGAPPLSWKLALAYAPPGHGLNLTQSVVRRRLLGGGPRRVSDPPRAAAARRARRAKQHSQTDSGPARAPLLCTALALSLCLSFLSRQWSEAGWGRHTFVG